MGTGRGVQSAAEGDGRDRLPLIEVPVPAEPDQVELGRNPNSTKYRFYGPYVTEKSGRYQFKLARSEERRVGKECVP